MKNINRRDYLKLSAATLATASFTGCSQDNQEPTQAGSAILGSQQEENLYETGTVPIDRSGWAAHGGVLPGYPVLENDLSVDVAIVGAGLAGCSLALHLTEAGINVAVLESRQPGWGASGRNAGHVLPTLRDLDVIKQFPDGGKRFFELFQEHHSIPFDLSKKHGFDCDAEQTGYLNAMTSEGVFKDWQKSSQFWQQQGQQVEFLNGSEMRAATGSSYYNYGVLFKSGGRVNPYLFSNGMIATAVHFGAQVFGNSEALTLQKVDQRWRVKTAQGSVTADRVVFCTNAYPTGIVPAVTQNFYPLTAYALCTKPLPQEAAEMIMPSRSTLAQMPIDLNPFIIDGDNRIITSSIPSVSSPGDAEGHFKNHLAWIHRTWPEAKNFKIELEHYWTGRVALRDKEFPGVFELEKDGVYGLMHFNAWGNVMAPLMGKIFAESLAQNRMDQLPFPLEKPEPVSNPNKQDLIIRKILIPAARLGQKLGFI